MKIRTCFIGLIALVYFLLGLGTPAFAEGLGLTELLVKSLGITTKQAEGGAGSIFNTAKQKMGAEDFSKVTTAMPEVEPLMAAAPKIEKGSVHTSNTHLFLCASNRDIIHAALTTCKE